MGPSVTQKDTPSKNFFPASQIFFEEAILIPWVDEYTYYYATDACSENRRFPVEMMHVGSKYENQIEAF